MWSIYTLFSMSITLGTFGIFVCRTYSMVALPNLPSLMIFYFIVTSQWLLWNAFGSLLQAAWICLPMTLFSIYGFCFEFRNTFSFCGHVNNLSNFISPLTLQLADFMASFLVPIMPLNVSTSFFPSFPLSHCLKKNAKLIVVVVLCVFTLLEESTLIPRVLTCRTTRVGEAFPQRKKPSKQEFSREKRDDSPKV